MIRPHLRAKRPLVGSRILPSDPREIRQGCQFVCSLFRSLNRIPGGFARFIPCQPSAHYARLVHVVWTQCGHGLSSRPRESCDILLLHPLLSFFGYPDGAASELYHVRLKLRYISTPFSRRPVGDMWMNLTVFPVFMFRLVIRTFYVLSNVFAPRRRVLLSSELAHNNKNNITMTPEYWDADDVALEMSDTPNILSDGSREDFRAIGGFAVAGAGVSVPASELAFDGSVWDVAEEYGDARLERCRVFMPVPGSCRLSSVPNSGVLLLPCRRTGLVIWVLITLMLLGVIGRLLDHDSLVKPLPLVKDGDLLALVQYMIRSRDRETVRVTKVKGHAEDVDVQQGRVRLVDQQENAEADTAADLGRRHQSEVLIDARRRLLKARSHWYPIMLDLHRFMLAVARVSVNHDGRGVLLLIPLFGIRRVGQKLESLLLGFMWIFRLFLALLVS